MMTDETQAPASRETDAAVARAMGKTVVAYAFDYRIASANGLPLYDLPPYSADTGDGYAAMQEVLAWLGEKRLGMCIEETGHMDDGKWCISCCIAGWTVAAPSLPLAVCRLAIAVARAEREGKS
jgi:hypothetical protein